MCMRACALETQEQPVPPQTVSPPSVHHLQNVIDRKPCPDDESLVEVKFASTPVMSTYLVAFVIGEYDYVESQSSDGITVRVYTPVGKSEQGKFALEVRVLPGGRGGRGGGGARGQFNASEQKRTDGVIAGRHQDAAVLQRVLRRSLSFAENRSHRHR